MCGYTTTSRSGRTANRRGTARSVPESSLMVSPQYVLSHCVIDMGLAAAKPNPGRSDGIPAGFLPRN